MSMAAMFKVWDSRFNKFIDPGDVHINARTGELKGIHGGPGYVEEWKLIRPTGLKDKKGVYIYEGDIVKAHYHYFDGNFDADGEIIGEIIYSEWCTFGIGNSSLFDNGGWMEIYKTSHLEEPCIEVIGNKFETPELLEG